VDIINIDGVITIYNDVIAHANASSKRRQFVKLDVLINGVCVGVCGCLFANACPCMCACAPVYTVYVSVSVGV